MKLDMPKGMDCEVFPQKQPNITESLAKTQDMQVETLDILRGIILSLSDEDIFMRPAQTIDSNCLCSRTKGISILGKSIYDACIEINEILRG